MTLLQTLIRPDREEHTQRAEVAKAANLLQVGEFQFLQLAYSEWHGREMSEELINRLFMRYMLYDQTPYWARHFAHHILGLDRQGELDEEDPAYHKYDRDYGEKLSRDVSRFVIAAAILVSLMGGALWLGHLIAGESASLLPPYFTQKRDEKHGEGTQNQGNAPRTGPPEHRLKSPRLTPGNAS